MASVRVKFFATVREVAGERSVEVDAENIRDLLDRLRERFGRKFEETVFDDDTGELKRFYSCMVNGKRIELLDGYDTSLADGDVVALFPPVGGG